MQFQNKTLWQCRDNKATSRCAGCQKPLCDMHAQNTPSAWEIFAIDCRCSTVQSTQGRAKFAKLRTDAADYLLKRSWDIREGRTTRFGTQPDRLDSLVLCQFDLHGDVNFVKFTALVDEFSIYIHSHSVCGHCELLQITSRY